VFDKRQRGATLMEVLVVVAIVGIISSMAITRIQNVSAADSDGSTQREQWERAACLFNLSITQSSTEYFAVFNGSYPTAPDDLYPHYLDRVPNCPAQATEYLYDEYHIIQCVHHQRKK